MEIIKHPKRQDCYYKLTAGVSNETSINLSSDILKLICPEGLKRGTSKTITFKLFRDDYVKALCYIVGKLPLYGRGRGNNVVRYSHEFFLKELKKITDFFTKNCVDYTVSILHKEDGRVYLRNLTYNGFNLRNFIVEEHTTMFFINSVELQIRLQLGDVSLTESLVAEYGVSVEAVDPRCKEKIIPNTDTVHRRLAVQDDVLKNFIYKVILLLSKKDNLTALEPYVEEKKNGNIQLKSQDKYKLTGMFIATSLNDLLWRNNFSTKARWFETEFTLLGKKVYLSTEWTGCGNYALKYDEFKLLVKDAYPEKFTFSKNKDKVYELWEVDNKDKTYPISINTYINQLTSLKTAKIAGVRAPHKPILLISIIDLIEKGVIRSNCIELNDALIRMFEYNWARCVGDSVLFNPVVGTPFWHLQNEPLWKLVSHNGVEVTKENLLGVNCSVSSLRKNIAHAEIDMELFQLLQSEDIRAKIKALLISTYLSDTEKKCEPSANSVY